MRKNDGLSLVEIIVAVMVFAVAAVPIYYAIAYNAADETNIGKRNLAQKIIQSFRDEIKDLDFDYTKELMDATPSWRKIDSAGMTPNAFNVLLKAQQQFKDFQFNGDVRISSDAAYEILEFKVEITWTSGRGRNETEAATFIKVRQ